MRHQLTQGNLAVRRLVVTVALTAGISVAAGHARAQDATGAAATGSWSSASDASKKEPPGTGRDLFQPFEVGLIAGGHFFEKLHGLGRTRIDSDGLSPDHGGTFGLRLGLNLNPWVGIEAEGLISPTRTRDDSTSYNVLAYRAQVIVNFIHTGVFRPFALVGFGALSGFPGDTAIVPRDTDGAFHAGLGAKFPINENFGIRVDGRVMAPPAFASGIVKSGDETHFDGPDYEALGSLYFAFGGSPPPPPPPAPPPPPPPAPVADPDPDHDGVLGDADKCPDKAEDRDAFEDEDGCPDPDNDSDGILDADDKCPLKAENKNGVDDEDGCPEEDTDGDGFFGSRDQCPDAPETKNGYKDDDGCPDEVPAAVKKFTGVIEGVNFKTGSAEILKGSYAVLDRAVAVLVEYGDVRLEISGHTDSVGKPDYNKDLSQRRADSVKAYFVGKGVKSERLTSVGYGMERPIADNKSSSGKAKNRRTEFKLLMSN
jgi:OOP family OmpA-OmpF porin